LVAGAAIGVALWINRQPHNLRKDYDPNTKSFFEMTIGPTSSYDEYYLSFSPEASQKLFDKKDKSKKC